MSGKQQAQQGPIGTIINPTPGGIQILAPVAPQVTIIVELSLEQMKAAMERCLQMRVQQSVEGKGVLEKMVRRDLKAI